MMRFSTTKGRPRKQAISEQHKQIATSELLEKHYLELTTEPFDLMLNRGLITPSMHKAGNYLRWLFNLSYGRVTLQAVHWDKYSTYKSKYREEAWYAEKREEYKTLMRLLHQVRADQAVLDLCIFHHYPEFLDPRYKEMAHKKLYSALSLDAMNKLITLQQGLEAIAIHLHY